MSRMEDVSQQGQQQTGMAQNLSEMGQRAKEAAQHQFENIRETASEYYEQGREKAVQWEHQFEDLVREQPIKSVLIAAGVGLVLGFIWRRI